MKISLLSAILSFTFLALYSADNPEYEGIHPTVVDIGQWASKQKEANPDLDLIELVIAGMKKLGIENPSSNPNIISNDFNLPEENEVDEYEQSLKLEETVTNLTTDTTYAHTNSVQTVDENMMDTSKPTPALPAAYEIDPFWENERFLANGKADFLTTVSHNKSNNRRMGRGKKK